ncbi:MAG TPA: VTT domain-containing protein [Candidatus Limnocylindrales bacterium]|nr:VTT domain-containing protein [Candidatus Limnocylindrales bacterium]
MTQLLSQFIPIALGTLVSEDLTCVAVETLISQGAMGFRFGVFACLAGIFVGDVLLFLAGRWIGSPMLRFLPADKVARASRWLSARGPAVVFVSRFTPGLRTVTYFAAGLLRMKFSSFSGYFLLAALAWTPLVVGLAAVLGSSFSSVRNGAAVAFMCAASVIWLYKALHSRCENWEKRRRFIGFLKRVLHWEFWPMWAAYIPLVPYWGYLALRHRSLTLFTAANPGIASGGLVGESKSAILGQLDRAAQFGVIPAATASHAKIYAANRMMEELALEYPVVLKPDVGERGSGVAIVRSVQELETYLRASTCNIILQRYIGGIEFGVFYYRFPHEARGRISSITEKRFPQLYGDGRHTLRELVLSDERAVTIASTYERLSKRSMDDVPQDGEMVTLGEIGSHCRGAVFADACWLRTIALERAIDKVAKSHAGFYFGRFDLRTPSIEAFQNGEFTVLELNGVGGEPTHIYDPSVNLFEAYRTMFHHWRVAFEIGRENRQRGALPMTLRELWTLIRGVKRAAHKNQPAVTLGDVESTPRPSR